MHSEAGDCEDPEGCPGGSDFVPWVFCPHLSWLSQDASSAEAVLGPKHLRAFVVSWEKQFPGRCSGIQVWSPPARLSPAAGAHPGLGSGSATVGKPAAGRDGERHPPGRRPLLSLGHPGAAPSHGVQGSCLRLGGRLREGLDSSARSPGLSVACPARLLLPGN